MARCSSCSADVPDVAKFCPSCGSGLAVGADTPTIDRSAEAGDATLHKPAASSTPASSPSRPSSQSGSLPHGRFLPGSMIGGRYRIVSILGRGGMGEVYRADDLSLGQQVALKFLPPELAHDPDRLERFRQEVRTARQVAHPNVCRVYDLGEIEGEHFISMEYVEGEDLGHLLRRIGQIPEAKAIQIARQIAAGLAAAHERKLVHRDLKPANIMLDERGMVRITDFGLAATIEELEAGSLREGTPQYMAPEQLEGGPVTPRSDVYALGLVLYELFTGKRAFDATTLGELLRIRQGSDLSSLSASLSAIDPAIERVILRCLEHDPARRPQSALAVSAALPGGDPLAAALAAGETPSPEMVAAAGDEGSLSPRVAMIILAFALAGLAILPFLSRWSSAAPPLTIEHGPEVMRTKAREMLERLGFEQRPVDSVGGFFTMQQWLEHIEETDSSPDRWRRLGDGDHPLYGYWYRESPETLVNYVFFSGVAGGNVGFSSPWPRRTGEALVTIDDQGRLWSLIAVPPQVSGVDSLAGENDPFERLLTEAGLEQEELKPVEPQWNPPVYADQRRAWQTELAPGIPMRIEAAVHGTQPVYFTRIFDWTEPERMVSRPPSTSVVILNAIQILIFFVIIGGAILMARRNIRTGRGDRRGAFRLATFVFLTHLTLWAFDADHVPSFSEFALLVIGISWALFYASMFWLIYSALEPYIRRRWPDMLISWTRLTSGRARDALVGRDLLIGAAAGIAITILVPHALYLTHAFLGNDIPRPRAFNVPVIEGPLTMLASLLSEVPGAIAGAFFATFLLFLLLVALRRQWLAAVGVVTIGVLLSTLGSQGDWLAALLFGLIWIVIVTLLVRFGMLTAIIAIFSANALEVASSIPGGFGPLTTVPILLSLAVGLALLITGFIMALGGRPVFDSLAESGGPDR